ncbi:MAG: hypothetical protein Q4A06_08925 [Cardiobacteriaceae bacterium]|nr:hypothetical protein [Cardiobacteriaceae bacterium]
MKMRLLFMGIRANLRPSAELGLQRVFMLFTPQVAGNVPLQIQKYRKNSDFLPLQSACCDKFSHYKRFMVRKKHYQTEAIRQSPACGKSHGR